MNLRSIAIDNHVENPLTGDDVISRIVNVSIGADDRYAKVSNPVGICYRSRIR
jgi:hypothetical protein